jgi:hypothetical protein
MPDLVLRCNRCHAPKKDGDERCECGGVIKVPPPVANRFAQAIQVQDACNLRAIARLLVKAADEAADAGGTDASYKDPAVILIVDKIESLVHSQFAIRNADAWDQCKRLANVEV